MKKLIAILALSPLLGMGFQTYPVSGPGRNLHTINVSLDGSVHGQTWGNGSSTTTITVHIGTPTAGDGITCFVAFANTATFTSVADNVNGTYSNAVPLHNNIAAGIASFIGGYYVANAGHSDTTVTLTYSPAKQYSWMGCEAWKSATAGTFALDTSMVQQQDGTTANPTSGSAILPKFPNELIMGFYQGATKTATAGTNYTLVDQNASAVAYPEYWIQTTATSTNAPFTALANNWTDQQAGFYFH